MKWIISHQSALEFWRNAKEEDVLAEKWPHAMRLQAKPLDAGELRAGNIWGLAAPLHVLVGGDNARKATRTLRCHISSGEFPGGSFVMMDSGLTVSSPELCFLQMAGELPFVHLVALGYEFCGAYRLDGKSDEGFRDGLPLANVGSLESYIAKAAGLKGRNNAMRALRFIADGSASPMETVLAILLVLPYKLGGYGFPKPLLNHYIKVPPGARKATDKSKYCCDLYWPKGKVDVEYDSDAYHTGSDRITQDAIRRNALTSMGITVVTASRKHVVEASKTRALAEVLSRLLGRRLQYPLKDFTYRQADLVNQLMSKAPMNVSD